YQWFDRKETPPAVYMPNIDVVTPTLISAGFNAPYPSSSTGALAGNANLLGVPGIGAGATANGKAVALAPTVDVGFLEPYPGLSKTFNVASAQDYRDTDLENLNAELDGKIGDHWVARSNFIYAWNRSIQQSTGIGTVNMAPPGSLTWNGSSWAPSVAWLTAAPGLTLAQTQAAAEYAFAQQILANPSQALQAQNGPGGTSVGAPAVISRRSRWIESDGHSDTAAADFAGHYGFDWGTLKPVFGVYFDQQYQYTVTRQSTGTTASPYSQTWDVDPASPTYYINQNNFIPVSTVISQIANPVSTTSLAYTTDEAVYGLLNGAFLHDRLEVTGGARYNRSSEITTNLVPGTLPSAQSPGLKGIHDLTPQLGLGYKVTKAIMPYVSYSESYTLASQSSLRVASVPTFPAPPTTSRGLDAGVKTDLLNGRVSSTLSVYEIQQKNAVLTLNGFTSTGATSSTDFETNVHAKGIEYEITYSILNNWQIYGSMAEEDIRVTKFSDPNSLDQPGLYNVLLGEHPQGTAKTLANTWTRYTFNNGSAKGLWIGAGFNYNGKSLADNRNPYFFIPSYWLWNSAVGYDWTWGKVDLSAAVNWENMTNETYTPANQETGLPERILLSVSAKF
ncbi:MAG: TonB-dependent receptor, partial [Opitutaceae bacterium]